MWRQRREWERAAVTGAATLVTIAAGVVTIVLGVYAVAATSAHLERRQLEAEVAAQFPTPDGWRLEEVAPLDARAQSVGFFYVTEDAHEAAEVEHLLDVFLSSADYRLTSRHTRLHEWDDGWSGVVTARAAGHGHAANISVAVGPSDPATVMIVISDEEHDRGLPEDPGFSSEVTSSAG